MNDIWKRRMMNGSMAVGLILFTLILLSGGCKLEEGLSYDLVPVDSVLLPETMAPGVSIGIKFYGTIGESGCHQFSHFGGTTIDANNFVVEVWKTVEKDSKICAAVVPMLDGREFDILFNQPGIYKMHIRQPDNSYTVVDIEVIDPL